MDGDGSIAVETDISGLLSALDVCCAEDTQESGTRAEILGYCWDASEDRYVRCEGYGTLHAHQLAFAKGDTQLAIAAPTRCGSVTIDTATLQPATATLTLCWNEAGRMELLRMRPEDFWSHLLLSARIEKSCHGNRNRRLCISLGAELEDDAPGSGYGVDGNSLQTCFEVASAGGEFSGRWPITFFQNLFMLTVRLEERGAGEENIPPELKGIREDHLQTDYKDSDFKVVWQSTTFYNKSKPVVLGYDGWCGPDFNAFF